MSPPRPLFFLLLLLAAGAVFPRPPADAQRSADGTLTVWGRVVDEATGEPVAGVQVMIPELRLGTLTNHEGAYLLHGVPRQQHVVQVRRIGFIPEQRELWGCVVPLPPMHSGCIPTVQGAQQLNFYLRVDPAVGYPQHTVPGRVRPSPSR